MANSMFMIIQGDWEQDKEVHVGDGMRTKFVLKMDKGSQLLVSTGGMHPFKQREQN